MTSGNVRIVPEVECRVRLPLMLPDGRTKVPGEAGDPPGEEYVHPWIMATANELSSDRNPGRFAMYVLECMTAAPVTIAPDATIADARQMLGLHGVRHLPVVERGRLLGMLSDRDVAISDIELRRAVRQNAVDALVSDERTVRSIMSSDVHTIGGDASIGDAARLMV